MEEETSKFFKTLWLALKKKKKSEMPEIALWCKHIKSNPGGGLIDFVVRNSTVELRDKMCSNPYS